LARITYAQGTASQYLNKFSAFKSLTHSDASTDDDIKNADTIALTTQIPLPT
jgi:hypothetical protein